MNEPITDEELAEMERVYAESEDWHWVHGHAGLQRPLIRRLVAALIESRHLTDLAKAVAAAYKRESAAGWDEARRLSNLRRMHPDGTL